ncbi:hypothetical protein, partial [Mailhella sp.]|uniref:hypothetical protein n=1 Tax=Mailhella sp. TaxID=1981029 RepID=UPI0040640A23
FAFVKNKNERFKPCHFWGTNDKLGSVLLSVALAVAENAVLSASAAFSFLKLSMLSPVRTLRASCPAVH